ncbi:hypothetical protein KUCAC02_032646, partial [Chaenocephalus aceratus]
AGETSGNYSPEDPPHAEGEAPNITQREALTRIQAPGPVSRHLDPFPGTDPYPGTWTRIQGRNRLVKLGGSITV